MFKFLEWVSRNQQIPRPSGYNEYTIVHLDNIKGCGCLDNKSFYPEHYVRIRLKKDEYITDHKWGFNGLKLELWWSMKRLKVKSKWWNFLRKIKNLK